MTRLTERITHSPAETEAAGEALAGLLGHTTLIGLRGDLGAGKTVFIRGLARGLGYAGSVTSPTFALVNEYRRGDRLILAHFDLCRIGPADLEDIGWYDYLDSGAVMAAEWSENAPEEFADACCVDITGSGDAPRRIRIVLPQ